MLTLHTTDIIAHVVFVGPAVPAEGPPLYHSGPQLGEEGVWSRRRRSQLATAHWWWVNLRLTSGTGTECPIVYVLFKLPQIELTHCVYG